MKFIDLFAGLGGFHVGLTNAGGFECVFASEIDSNLQKLYYRNHGIAAEGDITKIDEKTIPQHDLLCAGFPCQPFSLAGNKEGYKCLESGKLINDVLRVTKYHMPKLVLLENVPSILSIDNRSFWGFIEKSFNRIGYKLIYKIISPEDVGTPQNRKRIFVLGCRNRHALEDFKWISSTKVKERKLATFLESKRDGKKLEPEKAKQIKCWQNLLYQCNIKIPPSVSIVAPEFKATYPLDFKNYSLKNMRRYRGAYGASLKKCQSWNELIAHLPAYTRSAKKIPEWLSQSVEYSRQFYRKRKLFVSKWINTLDKRYNSWQILEWRGYSETCNLSDHILQFRASGIRVSKKEKVPSFVAMTPTQVPVIGSQMRYISKSEMARLQHLHTLPYMLDNDTEVFKAFGNAVNAKIVELLADSIKNMVQSAQFGGVQWLNHLK